MLAANLNVLLLFIFTKVQDGKALKILATASRLDIEDFLLKKVYLEVVTLYHAIDILNAVFYIVFSFLLDS